MIQLNKRERISVICAGIAVVLFVLLQFVFFPLTEKREKLTKSLAAREKAAAEMQVMQEQYKALSKQSGSIASMLAKREAGFSLFSFLEKNAAESKVKENIAYMKPSESLGNELFKQSMVEMKLQAVGLRQVVQFLEVAESPENLVGIDKITIQENTKEKATLDVTLHMVSVDQVVSSAPGQPK